MRIGSGPLNKSWDPCCITGARIGWSRGPYCICTSHPLITLSNRIRRVRSTFCQMERPDSFLHDMTDGATIPASPLQVYALLPYWCIRCCVPDAARRIEPLCCPFPGHPGENLNATVQSSLLACWLAWLACRLPFETAVSPQGALS
jgi:hypothetical protein